MATGTTEFVDVTTAAVFIPEIWSQEAIVARQSRTVFARLVNRIFERGLTWGDTIHVPSVSNLSARSKTANTAITFETQTETNTDITIATHEYSAMAVEDIVKVQNNRDQMALYAGKMGYALDLSVDDVLAGFPDDATNAVGTLGADLTYENLLRARQYLDDADAPMDDRVIAVAPAQESGMMKLDNFINSDYAAMGAVTTGNAPERGRIGSWLGMPIYKSTNVEGTNAAGHDNTMFQKEAWALVMQMMPKSESQRDIDFLVDKVAMQQLSGARVMRDDHSVFMRGS